MATKKVKNPQRFLCIIIKVTYYKEETRKTSNILTKISKY